MGFISNSDIKSIKNVQTLTDNENTMEMDGISQSKRETSGNSHEWTVYIKCNRKLI